MPSRESQSVRTQSPRYVELVRVSSQGQAARDTPEDQRRSLDHLREARPGILVERIDSAISGAKDSDHRTDIQRLAALARERAFDEIRVRHTDRLTRHDDPRERFAVYGIIADAGAVIVDGSGRVLDPHSELGELTWYFETLMASKERKRIVERTHDAKDRLAKEGRLVHGRPPFARTWDKKKGWGIDEDLAALYRRMFDFILHGETTHSICRILGNDFPPGPLGGTLTPARVSHLLHDPAATGFYETHGHSFTIPSIVDAATQKAVLEKLAANNHNQGGRPANVVALLRKLAVCGACGSPLYVDKGGHGKHVARYYVCSSGDDCTVYHRLDKIDATVRAVVEKWLREPRNEVRAVEHRTGNSQDFQAEIEEWESELRDLDKQEEKSARLLRRGLIREQTGTKMLKEVSVLRADAEARLNEARVREASASRHVELANALEEKLSAMREGIAKATPEQWRDLFVRLFPRGGVKIYPTGKIELRGAVALDRPLPSGPIPSTGSRGGRRFAGGVPIILGARAEHSRGRPPRK